MCARDRLRRFAVLRTQPYKEHKQGTVTPTAEHARFTITWRAASDTNSYGLEHVCGCEKYPCACVRVYVQTQARTASGPLRARCRLHSSPTKRSSSERTSETRPSKHLWTVCQGTEPSLQTELCTEKKKRKIQTDGSYTVQADCASLECFLWLLSTSRGPVHLSIVILPALQDG